MPVNQIITSAPTTYQYIVLHGEIPMAGIQVQVKSRRGMDGVEVDDVGVKPDAGFLVSFHDCHDADEMDADRVAVKEVQGDIVSIYDRFGTLWTNLVVTRVSILESGPLVGATSQKLSVNAAFFLRIRWDLVPLATYYV